MDGWIDGWMEKDSEEEQFSRDPPKKRQEKRCIDSSKTHTVTPMLLV